MMFFTGIVSISVRFPNAQPAPATGLFKGFGVAHLWSTRQLKSTVQNEQLIERHTLQAMSLSPQRLETAVPGSAVNRCFRLLGGIPNPPNRPRPRKLRIPRLAASGKARSLRCSSSPHAAGRAGTPLWSGCAAILLLSGYRPLLIFRSRLRSGKCGFSNGTGAVPSKVSVSVRPACFRNS